MNHPNNELPPTASAVNRPPAGLHPTPPVAPCLAFSVVLTRSDTGVATLTRVQIRPVTPSPTVLLENRVKDLELEIQTMKIGGAIHDDGRMELIAKAAVKMGEFAVANIPPKHWWERITVPLVIEKCWDFSSSFGGNFFASRASAAVPTAAAQVVVSATATATATPTATATATPTAAMMIKSCSETIFAELTTEINIAINKHLHQL